MLSVKCRPLTLYVELKKTKVMGKGQTRLFDPSFPCQLFLINLFSFSLFWDRLWEGNGPVHEMDLQRVGGDNEDSGPEVAGLLDRLACCQAG